VRPDRQRAITAARRRISSRTEFRKVLRRAGYSATQAESILHDLPDLIDFDRDAPALLRQGVTLDRLINALGGSP
jgi:hypothetical protein